MRATVTTTPAILVSSAGGSAGSTGSARSFAVFSPTSAGTVLLKQGSTKADTPPDMADAARWDFSKMALETTLPPGVALWAATSSGTVALDGLEVPA